jgi:uncharacterized membrane protein
VLGYHRQPTFGTAPTPMKSQLLNLWDALRTSYWFIPTLFAAASVVAAIYLPLLDDHLADTGVDLPEWLRTTTPVARTVLATMAGAMVAVTGTVFSITVVTLSLASQQFGPRLLRRFMYDLPTQITLGVFLSTGLYCLLLLRAVEQTNSGATVPHVAVFSATVLVAVSVIMLIAFIQNVATLIQAPQVVAAVARDLNAAITRLYPESESDDDGARASFEHELEQPFHIVRSRQEGYIQALDESGLATLARDLGLVLRLRVRPGHFIAEDSLLAEVWARQDDEAPVDLPLVDEKFDGLMIVGVRRVPRQDVIAAVEELVEVAVRALSPGINDPFTAVNCVDRLGAALARIAHRPPPERAHYDAQGALRLITEPPTFAHVLDAAFDQIRQHAGDSISVVLRVLEALATVAAHATAPEDRAAVRRHVAMLERLGDRIDEADDRAVVHERCALVAAMLDGTPSIAPVHPFAEETGQAP